jgi:hypothetical protein
LDEAVGTADFLREIKNAEALSADLKSQIENYLVKANIF